MPENGKKIANPNLSWDWGTAYDFFISMQVLHEPATFGLRAAWAAGMRSRMPVAERETLEQFQQGKLLGTPLHWVYEMPEPKDGASVIKRLSNMTPSERIESMVMTPRLPSEFKAVMDDVDKSGSWDDSHIDELVNYSKEHKGEGIDREALETLFEWWIEREDSGERLLRALRAYYEVFFAEEENRIRPALQSGLERAQGLAERMSVQDLLEELSQGVILEEGFEAPNLVLAPSFWGSPLLIFDMISEDTEIILFGARPLEASLVPGEVVPDALLRGLKALSDSTRLRILRYLSEEALTPSQLSRRLRLRSSTVVHHLDVLRLATLVQFRLGEHGKDRRYAIRPEAIASLLGSLEVFLGQAEAFEADPMPAEAEVSRD